MSAMRLRLALLFALPLALLAGCATGPRTVDISRQQIQSALDRRFPYETRAAQLVAVKVGAPRLDLLPEANRLRLDFPIDLNDRILRGAGHGELAVSFGVRWEPSDTSLRAVNVRVEKLELQGLAERLRAPLELVGSLVAEQVLEGAPLHTFRADEVARAQGWTPGDIRVTPAGVSITLQPPVH